MDCETSPFPKLALEFVTFSGGCGLNRRYGTRVGNQLWFIKILELKLCLLQLRENAVQLTPPRAHSAGADYGIYNELNWNDEEGNPPAVQFTTYQSLFCVNLKCKPFNVHFLHHLHLSSGTSILWCPSINILAYSLENVHVVQQIYTSMCNVHTSMYNVLVCTMY